MWLRQHANNAGSGRQRPGLPCPYLQDRSARHAGSRWPAQLVTSRGVTRRAATREALRTGRMREIGRSRACMHGAECPVPRRALPEAEPSLEGRGRARGHIYIYGLYQQVYPRWTVYRIVYSISL